MPVGARLAQHPGVVMLSTPPNPTPACAQACPHIGYKHTGQGQGLNAHSGMVVTGQNLENKPKVP